MSATQLKNGVRAWHEELLEFIIANPRASGAEIAFHFNVTQTWVSIVKNSDAFKELWAQRRGDHFSRVSATIVEKVSALADVTVDALSEEVEKQHREGTASIASLRETADLALRSLGFGGKQHSVNSPAYPINVNVNTDARTQNIITVDRDTLARAREAKKRLQQTIQLQELEDLSKEAQVVEATTITEGNQRKD